LISLPMFRVFVAPYVKEMIECIHGWADACCSTVAD